MTPPSSVYNLFTCPAVCVLPAFWWPSCHAFQELWKCAGHYYRCHLTLSWLALGGHIYLVLCYCFPRAKLVSVCPNSFFPFFLLRLQLTACSLGQEHKTKSVYYDEAAARGEASALSAGLGTTSLLPVVLALASQPLKLPWRNWLQDPIVMSQLFIVRRWGQLITQLEGRQELPHVYERSFSINTSLASLWASDSAQ